MDNIIKRKQFDFSICKVIKIQEEKELAVEGNAEEE